MEHGISMRRATKALVSLALMGLGALPAVAQERGDDTDRPSKNGVATGSMEGVDVTITYGRPKVRGRSIFGALVPWGEVWRAGANEATTITFDAPAKVAGRDVAAGTYALFFLPESGEWELILNRVANQWGAFNYDAAQDVLRAPLPVEECDAVEELTFSVEGPDVVMRWDRSEIRFEVGR